MASAQFLRSCRDDSSISAYEGFKPLWKHKPATFTGDAQSLEFL